MVNLYCQMRTPTHTYLREDMKKIITLVWQLVQKAGNLIQNKFQKSYFVFISIWFDIKDENYKQQFTCLFLRPKVSLLWYKDNEYTNSTLQQS